MDDEEVKSTFTVFNVVLFSLLDDDDYRSFLSNALFVGVAEVNIFSIRYEWLFRYGC